MYTIRGITGIEKALCLAQGREFIPGSLSFDLIKSFIQPTHSRRWHGRPLYRANHKQGRISERGAA